MKIKSFQPFPIKIWNMLSFRQYKQGMFLLDEIMSAAIKRSEVSDFGDMDFLEGLKNLVVACNQCDIYTPFGRFYMRQMIIAMLVHRLRNVDLLKHHPEIHNESIVKPVIVLGLPRSGTTLLFNLLAQDSTHRFMPNWEAFIAQVPPQGDYSFEKDPRRNQAKWMLRFQKYLMPNIDTVHAFASELPEECTPILMQSFATQAYAGGFNVPAFSLWLDDADHLPTYKHHKKVLQALQWKYPGERWLLKSPDHLSAVETILKVYPDARLVHIHRDPVKSVSSWASLNLIYRGVYYPYVDSFELGEQVLNRLANDIESYMENRSYLPSSQFHDLAYTEFIKNPIDIVHQIYDRFGLELSGKTVDKMHNLLSVNPKDKHGVHKYKPEDFGLTATMIQQRFEKYINTFLK